MKLDVLREIRGDIHHQRAAVFLMSSAAKSSRAIERLAQLLRDTAGKGSQMNELDRLKLEIETLRNLREKSDTATAEVIRVLKAEHDDVVALLSSTERMLRAELAAERQQNHGDSLAEANATIAKLRSRLEDMEVFWSSLKSDVVDLARDHFSLVVQ